MKNKFYLIALLFCFAGCEKQTVESYDQTDKVNFGTGDVLKTVLFNNAADLIAGKDSTYITINIITMGQKRDKPVNLFFKQVIPNGVNDVANVKLVKNPLLIDYTKSTYIDSIIVRRPKKPKVLHSVKIAFDFDQSPTFSKGVIENETVQMNVSDRFTETTWWSAYVATFGAFSDAKYRLMLLTTKDINFYSTSAKRLAAVNNSKTALAAYNVANPGNPLLDDATPGQPITFP